MKNKSIFHLASIFLITLLSLSFTGVPTTLQQDLEHVHLATSESKVYVCGGNYATKFHSHDKCRGLNNCKGGVYYMDSQAAAVKSGYKYCSICWK